MLGFFFVIPFLLVCIDRKQCYPVVRSEAGVSYVKGGVVEVDRLFYLKRKMTPESYAALLYNSHCFCEAPEKKTHA